MNTKLLINGKLVAGKGRRKTCSIPRPARRIAAVAEASEEQIDMPRCGRGEGVPRLVRTVPKDRAALLLKVADRIEAEAADFAKLESQNCGKPLTAVLNDEIPAIADVFRFFAGAARTLHGALAGEYLPGLHQHDPPRSGRRRRVDRALELSVDDGGVEAVARARRRQHGRDQAFRADAADDAEAGDAARRAVSAGRRQRDLRTRHDGRRTADRASAGRDDLADGRCRHRRERCCRPRRKARSARISSSAARRPSSCSTMPISNPSSAACAPSASTTPARTARPPAASTPARRSTTSSSRI